MSLLCTSALILTAALMRPVAQTLFCIPEISLSFLFSSFPLLLSLSYLIMLCSEAHYGGKY